MKSSRGPFPGECRAAAARNVSSLFADNFRTANHLTSFPSTTFDDNQSEHCQAAHEWMEEALNGAPEGKEERRHQIAGGDSSRDQIAERHNGLDQLDLQIGELRLPAQPVALEHNPGKGSV